MEYHYSKDSMDLTLRDQCKAWLITLTGALFFFYEFIQMNMMNSLAGSFVHTFHLNAFELGLVSAFYFLSDTLLLYPAGVLTDRVSSRKLIIMGMIMCIFGTLLITVADNPWFLIIARFLAGTASAFCLLSILRLASGWFPLTKIGQATGVIVTLGMLGGAVSQTPLALMIHHFGWRIALRYVALLGGIILLLIIVLVKDAPSHRQFSTLQYKGGERFGLWQSFCQLAKSRNNWLTGIFIGTMNLPIMLLAGLFGSQFLSQAHGLSHVDAATVSMMIFIGTIVGSTVFGVLSDLLCSRRLPMLMTAFISLGIFLLIVYLPTQSYFIYLILFFLLGMFTGAQIIGYPVVQETNRPELVGSALGFVSVIIMGLPIILQPLMGWLIAWGHTSGILHYSISDYRKGLWVLIVGFVLSIYTAWRLPETFGLRLWEKNND